MPVDGRTQQPFGLLHGGASVVLAETLGSYHVSLTEPVELLQRGLTFPNHPIISSNACSGWRTLSWQQAMQRLPRNRCLVTGYSCRSQVKRIEGSGPTALPCFPHRAG
jgi:hypothetical protein